MIYLIWAFMIVAALVLYFGNKFSRFKPYGMKYEGPLLFIKGFSRLLFQKATVVDDLDRIYKEYRGERFIGKYEFVKPSVILMNDIELLKKITMKDFEYFVDRRHIMDEKYDPLFGRNLFALKGQDWKEMRSVLSPAFTSSKMKTMLPFMVEVGNQMVMTLKKNIKESGVDYIDVEGKDLSNRYANDVIATCAFGLNVNSHVDENNEFLVMGRSLSSFDLSRVLKLFGYMMFPKIMMKFSKSIFPDKLADFFSNIIVGTMRERERKNIIRPDMIHLLMEAKKGQLSHDKATKDTDAGFATVEESHVGKKEISRELTDNDVIAQAILFFLAGFDTVATAMSWALHELALNPDVQDRLYNEIKENEVNNGGKFDYKSIQDMTYMDMVVSEVLRLWPPAPVLERQCVKDYNMGRATKTATEDFIIRKDEIIAIPAWSYHRDPEFFPNPKKFDPERFSEENKHKINPLIYMPFGLGPRNCIGSRFALCEVKVMLYQLLQHMELSPCEKTCIPSELTKEVKLQLKGGHWIRLKIRK